MAFRNPYNRDKTVAVLLGIINSLIASGEKVYYVNVHCVGMEYHIGHYSLEAICADWRTWYNFETRERINLTEQQYQQVKKVLEEQWKKDGRLTKDRGLY